MPLFDIPNLPTRADTDKLAKKANSKVRQTATVKSGSSLIEKIARIKSEVDKKLGHLADDYIIVREEDVLHEYISRCIENGVISIDTETTGLDPLLDKLVGICIYTPCEKAVYIPVNHTSYVTGMKVENQLQVDILKREFQRVVDENIDVIMFNASFDIRFMMQAGVKLHCTWDCYLGSRCLNENEAKGSGGLKPLHQKYVLNGEGDAFSFGDLFSGITFDLIPINTAYIYAAHDAIITYELYKYQLPFLTPDNIECTKRGLEGVAWVFHNIEMPCVDVIVEMENTGIQFDFDYNEELKEKYHALLDEKEEKFHNICNEIYSEEISAYRNEMGADCKLDDPINIASPAQIAIMLYDIMGCPLYKDKRSKKESRSTAEAALAELDNPVSKAVLEYRAFSTIVSTFIDKLPNCVNPNDGRIHCKFNQYGADTGRMSSSDPNLQNIPSHNKDIRKMFKATDGYVLMSSDYSQQEPKCLAALCREQGDSQMYNTFMQGKDLYSEIASKAFNKPYEECREFNVDGTTNKAGKERRSQAKSILLGVLYGRGVPSIAEQLGTTTKKAQDIKDSVFRGFPAIRQFEQSSIEMAQTKGFVTTVCGRKRRLPSMMKPDYEFKWKDDAPHDMDVLDFDAELSDEVPEDRQIFYWNKLMHCKFGEKRKVFEQANAEGIWIIDNTMDKDVTKVVNARIQGSAADLTKLAMIKLNSSARLKELGFRLLIPVHDELIAECPEENVKECSELLAKTMSDAAEEILKMPIKCDVAITKCWYGDELCIN